jgi:hypothetical protein
MLFLGQHPEVGPSPVGFRSSSARATRSLSVPSPCSVQAVGPVTARRTTRSAVRSSAVTDARPPSPELVEQLVVGQVST